MEIKTKFNLEDEVIIKSEINNNFLTTRKIEYIKTGNTLNAKGELTTEIEYGFDRVNDKIRYFNEKEIIKLEDSLNFINEDCLFKTKQIIVNNEKLKEKLLNMINYKKE